MKNQSIEEKYIEKKISEIKLEFENTELIDLKEILLNYENDSRNGVKNLCNRFRKKHDLYLKELFRLEQMRTYEKNHSNYKYICGIDEAGRGPLAGPVVAGAVILPIDCEILYLNDSKKLSATKRDTLYNEILEKAVAWGIGIVSSQRIDEINILQATYEAMKESISKLKVKPDFLLNDAVTIPNIKIPQMGIIKGDSKSMSIAAASIIAKVTRDRIMTEYDKLYSGYDFASNKGYGSSVHIAALKEKGAIGIHRRSFIRNFIDLEP
jgi:Ribonuclease HII